jgi:hypothetical protein
MLVEVGKHAENQCETSDEGGPTRTKEISRQDDRQVVGSARQDNLRQQDHVDEKYADSEEQEKREPGSISIHSHSLSRGSEKQNVLPLPSSLSNHILPLCRSIISLLMYRPRPDPTVLAIVAVAER